MLQREFFLTDSFNPSPYWNATVINLSGAQKFEENTVFRPGRYRVELAPGVNGQSSYDAYYPILNMSYDEVMTDSFIVRAYCGSNGNFNAQTCGTNPYVGAFKVNGIDARTINRDNYPHGIDVTHIFGAGGGNAKYYNSTSGTGPGTSSGGGPNCLGDGSVSTYSDTTPTSRTYGAAGACLHILPVGGVFGTHYLRAYHASPLCGLGGSAYGGGDGYLNNLTSVGAFRSRGGNSPYGNGAQNYYDSATQTTIRTDTGIGGANKLVTINGRTVSVGAGAYFNGSQWSNATGYVFYNGSNSSYIRLIYLGPLH